MKQIKLLALAFFVLIFGVAQSQTPSYGVHDFNNSAYDLIPFAGPGVAYPSVMTATNVASSGFSFHIGAIGAFVITQLDHGSSSYDGAITASDVTPSGNPRYYQTFAFTSTNYSKFKLNGVKVKVSNTSGAPVLMYVAGIVAGESSGSIQPLYATPGNNWYTVNTSINPNFTNINGVILINPNGSAAIAEMAFDDIDIAAPIVQPNTPVYTTQPTNKTICSTASGTFTASATNAVAYQWLISTDGTIWNPIDASNAGTTFSGYTTNVLTVTNPSSALNGLYVGVTAANASGVNKGSNAVRLYVTAAPTVAAISGDNSLCVGSTKPYTCATPGGTWSFTANRVSIATTVSGVNVTGTSAGNTSSLIYTVAGAGGCNGVATKALVVNALPNIPSFAYAPGTISPQTTSVGGVIQMCTNRTFTLVGNPTNGVWSQTGSYSTSPLGTPSTNVTVNTTGATGMGSLTYTVTNVNGCSNSRTMSANFVACGSKGVAASTATNPTDFVIYPNPAKGKVNINIDNAVAGSTISVTALTGKIVKTQPLSIGANNLDFSNLTKGMYFVSIQNAKGERTTQKLIVE